MKKKIEAAAIDKRKKYIIKYRERLGRASKVLFLDELMHGEMNEVVILIGELKIEDKGDLISNALALNSAMSVNDIVPKLCSIILYDEKREKHPMEFYQSCVASDLHKPVEDFFNDEGSDLLKSIARVVYAPLLKKMEGENAPASLPNIVKDKIRVLDLLLEKMEGENTPASLLDIVKGQAMELASLLKGIEEQNDPASLFYNRLKDKIGDLKAVGRITPEMEELLLSKFHEMQ